MSKKRTYLESYVDVGFDFIATNDVQKPQCIFCSKVLGHGSMKPSILKAHFTSCHSTHVHQTTISLCWPNVVDFVLQEHYLNLDSVPQTKQDLNHHIVLLTE